MGKTPFYQNGLVITERKIERLIGEGFIRIGMKDVIRSIEVK